eukprot:8888955-Karenia_brevis.AAC.1
MDFRPLQVFWTQEKQNLWDLWRAYFLGTPGNIGPRGLGANNPFAPKVAWPIHGWVIGHWGMVCDWRLGLPISEWMLVSWVLRPSWVNVERSWGHLGYKLGRLGGILTPSWT